MKTRDTKNTALEQERLVSEPLKPIFSDPPAAAVKTGEPILPGSFNWRGKHCAVTQVLDQWKTTGPCTHGSGEQYVRRHYYRLQMAGDDQWTVYFERKPRSRATAGRLSKAPRWHLYSIIGSDTDT